MIEQIAGLHSHSHFSPLDGYCTPQEMVVRAKEIGMSALSITDHGTLSGHREFQRQCKEYDIKPLLGEELYYSETDRWDRRAKAKRQDGTSIYVHLIGIAINDNGLHNLRRMDQKSWDSYYNKPRLDFEVLEELHEDIIFTSACMGGLLGKAFDRGDQDYAYDQVKKFKDLLGDRYYIEIQSHNPPELNKWLLSIADEMHLKPVLAEDSHYASPDQKIMEEIFLVLSTHPKMSKEVDLSKASKMELLDRLNYLYPDRIMTFQDINLCMGGIELRREELLKQGIDREDIYENTLEIADRVQEYTYEEDLETLPELYDDPAKVLREKVYAGLEKKNLLDDEHINRVEAELGPIEEKGYANYILVVADLMDWARSKDIRLGPGRGSVGGSECAYALDIITFDPLQHNLLFERFIDVSRNDPPDIDIDVMDSRREEVKQYLADKYGYVANISNILTYKGKKAITDAARALGIKYADIKRAMKCLDGIDEITGHDVIAEFVKKAPEFNKEYPEVAKIAKRLFGRIYSYGMHAAGVVITENDITNYAPMETRKAPGSDERVQCTALDKLECESVGLIKMDLLGLSNLTIIDDTIEFIRKHKGKLIDINKVSLDDAEVFQMLAEGKTAGVFQLEASASTKLIVQMGCESFNDIVVSNALVRPGAWNAIGKDYLAAKKNPRKAQFIHEDVKYFMDETYGYPIYQEQMMKLAVELAGFTVAESNALRRGIGKKKREIIDKFKPQFIEGASKKIDKNFAEKLWTSFEESGAYAFNKSHSVGYSLISYQTAWLKKHYPLEYMCALLRNTNDVATLTDYLLECKTMGIRIILPHINKSDVNFTIDGDGLRMGLQQVKFISDKSAKRIIAHRPYKNYSEFKQLVEMKNSGLTTRMLSSLNKFGGATFDDHPRPDDYKDHLYEILGIPSFNPNSMTANMRQLITPLDEYSEDETFVAMGMVKNIKNGTGWMRVDMLDNSGTAAAFANPGSNIIKGRMYLFLIGNNSIVKYIDLEEIDSAMDDPLLDYLRRPTLDEIVQGQFKIIAAQARERNGKETGTVVVCDENKDLQTLKVFSNNIDVIRRNCRIGSVRALKIGEFHGQRHIKGID